MITVVLVEPQEEGNVGAVTRAMANFDLNDLIIINPKCNHLAEDARRRAVHATKILENAKIKKSFSFLKKFDYVVGTTSQMGTDYNITRSPLLPDEFAKKLPKKSSAAIIFGRESTGLSNKELEMCDFIVTIPSSKKYHSLNLSHAANIIFYELYKINGKNKITSHIPAATKKEKEIILLNFYKILDQTEFSTKEKKETQKLVWKKLFSKAMLTKREAFAVIGMLKKIRR
jgi:tRNA/rRNA methyltransferase